MERRKYETLEEFGRSIVEVTGRYKEILGDDKISIKDVLDVEDENDRRLLMAVLISKGITFEPIGYVASAAMEAVTGEDFETQFDTAMYLCNEASTEKLEQLFKTVFFMAKTVADILEKRVSVERVTGDDGNEANN